MAERAPGRTALAALRFLLDVPAGKRDDSLLKGAFVPGQSLPHRVGAIQGISGREWADWTSRIRQSAQASVRLRGRRAMGEQQRDTGQRLVHGSCGAFLAALSAMAVQFSLTDVNWWV